MLIISFLEGKLNLEIPLLLLTLDHQIVTVGLAPVKYQMVRLKFQSNVLTHFLYLAVHSFPHQCLCYMCILESKGSKANVEIDSFDGVYLERNYILRATRLNIDLHVVIYLRSLLRVVG